MAIQFTSQVLPPSSENACLKPHESGVMSDITMESFSYGSYLKTVARNGSLLFGVLRRVFRSARPSGQLPRPLPLLMCPASPIITNSLPHLFANVCARESVTYGSFELATTILRNRSRSSGIGLKPLGPDGKLGASGSLGATRSAPRMGLEESPTAQCATSAHPALCATSTVSGPVSATA